MIDGGYFVKRIVARPEWLNALSVREICSAADCICPGPAGWIEHWLHNEFGWFNRVPDALAVVPAGHSGPYRIFAYRLYPQFFREGRPQDVRVPADVHPDAIPATFVRLGFDAVSKSQDNVLGFECSPLSCNRMAEEMTTNANCLFDSLDAAVDGARRFSIEQPEPGDYYVVEVLEAPSVVP